MRLKTLLGLLAVLLTLDIVTAQADSGLGNPCNTTTPCDKKKYLKCSPINNTCQCSSPSTTWVDGACKSSYNSACDPTGTSNPLCNNKASLECNSNNFCTCPQNTVWNGTVCKGLEGASCGSGQLLCQSDAYLTCSYSSLEGYKCRCSSDNVWNSTAKSCLATKDAHCSPTGVTTSPKCLNVGLECNSTTSTCQCQKGYIWSESSGNCTLGYNSSCSVGDVGKPCGGAADLHLMCTQASDGTSTSKCLCQPGSVWVDQFMSCRANYGTPCPDALSGLNSGAPLCDSSQYLFCNGGTCNCKNGSYLLNNKCTIPYGGSCPTTMTLSQDRCNAWEYQECSSGGICGCSNSTNTWYDPDKKACTLLTGSTCTTVTGGQSCGFSALCNVTSESSQTGVCGCDWGQAPNPERKCDYDFGTPCLVASDLCDRTKRLVCNGSSKRCDCADPLNQEYDAGMCRTKPAGFCSTNGDCVSLAKCNTTTKTCSCKAPLVSSLDRKCVIPFGALCGSTVEGSCNSAGNQICSTYGACACSEPSVSKYDPKDMKCYLNLGSSCPSTAGGTCRPDMKCDPTGNKCMCDTSKGFINDGSGRCVLSQGSPCSTGLYESKCRGNLECRTGSSTWGTCECKANYTQIGSGFDASCFGNYSAQCSVDMDCFPDFGCINGACACKSSTVYEPSAKKCYLTIGARCTPGSSISCKPSELACNSTSNICICNATKGLVPNSQGQCTLGFGTPCRNTPEDKCNAESHLLCSNVDSGTGVGTCGCQSGYSPPAGSSGLNTKCYGNYSASCSAPSDCYTPLNCWGKKCSCADALTVYDPWTLKCFLPLDTPCSPSGGSTCNALYSFCNGTTSRCECDGKKGLVSNGKGQCVTSYGYLCQNGTTMGGTLRQCNEANNLVCANNNNNGTGTCLCKSRYSPLLSSNYPSTIKCYGGYSSPCTAPTDCNSTAGLTCDPNSKSCTCFNSTSMVYSDQDQKCYSIPGANCTLYNKASNTTLRDTCRPSDSTCNPNTGKCICNMDGGWTSSGTGGGGGGGGSCSRAIGASCAFTVGINAADPCSQDDHLYCNTTIGTCQCQCHYIQAGDKCYGSYNTVCSSAWDCHVGASLTCREGRCQCYHAGQVFDPKGNHCVSPSGGQCLANGTEANSNNSTSSTAGPYAMGCDANMECLSNVCKCKTGFKPDAKGICINGSVAVRMSFALVGLYILSIVILKQSHCNL